MQTKELIEALRVAAKSEPILLTMPQKETKRGKFFSQAADALEAMEAALQFYAEGCDSEKWGDGNCGYDGNLCCKAARAVLTPPEAE